MDDKLELVLIPVQRVVQRVAFRLGDHLGPHPERGNYESFADFSDPDGNIWVLQEVDRGQG